MPGVQFSQSDMDRVARYRLLVLLTLAGLAITVVQGPALLELLQPEQAAEDTVDSEEEALTMDGGDADSDQSEGEEAGMAPARDEEPAPGATTSDGGGLAIALLASLLIALMTVGMLSGLGVGLAVSEGVRTGVLLALAGPLLARLNRGERDVQTRGRIAGFVEAHPGIHFSALRDALALANGVTAHHLYQLEKQGDLLSWQDGRRRRYAVSGLDPKRLDELEHPVTGMQLAILELLSERSDIGLTATDMRVRLEASRQLMSYHLSQLRERELVARQGKGRKALWQLSDSGENQLSAIRESALV